MNLIKNGKFFIILFLVLRIQGLSITLTQKENIRCIKVEILKNCNFYGSYIVSGNSEYSTYFHVFFNIRPSKKITDFQGNKVHESAHKKSDDFNILQTDFNTNYTICMLNTGKGINTVTFSYTSLLQDYAKEKTQAEKLEEKIIGLYLELSEVEGNIEKLRTRENIHFRCIF